MSTEIMRILVNKINMDKMAAFRTEASESTFLFDKDVKDKNTEIGKISLAVLMKTAAMNDIEKAGIGNQDINEKYNRLVETRKDMILWHTKQLKEIEQLFEKYLK